MCEVINATVNWTLQNPSLIVSIVAVIVTLRVGRRTISLMQEQAREARKERQDQALAEQRYEIYLALKDLVNYYFLISQPTDMPLIDIDMTEAIPIKQKVRELLSRPTIMKKDEISEIYKVVAHFEGTENPKELHDAARRVQDDLENKIRPELHQVMTETIMENAARKAKQNESSKFQQQKL
jgi:hypothetical protein